ncbi:MAG: hypothetical protein GX596_11140 [Propionibacterium sp.]|nr:hypothetical protein [Propionibacterium sp.]
MEIWVNFWLALALVAAAVFVVARAAWLRQRVEHYDVLRTVSVAVTLLLVPVNLVFAFTGSLGVFNAVVMTASIVALGTQGVIAYQWRTTPTPAPAGPDPVDDTDDTDDQLTAVIMRGPLRVLAVGTDARALERAGLEAFTNSGGEVFALVMGDKDLRNVGAAERTIVVGRPDTLLHEREPEMARVIAEHIGQLAPSLILAPADNRLAHGAVRRAVARIPRSVPVLYYPGLDDAVEPTTPAQLEHTRHWPFRPPADDAAPTGRVTMPSFIDR